MRPHRISKPVLCALITCSATLAAAAPSVGARFEPRFVNVTVAEPQPVPLASPCWLRAADSRGETIQGPIGWRRRSLGPLDQLVESIASRTPQAQEQAALSTLEALLGAAAGDPAPAMARQVLAVIASHAKRLNRLAPEPSATQMGERLFQTLRARDGEPRLELRTSLGKRAFGSAELSAMLVQGPRMYMVAVTQDPHGALRASALIKHWDLVTRSWQTSAHALDELIDAPRPAAE